MWRRGANDTGNLELALAPGMNVLTGENGCGKSAVLTALVVALGQSARRTNRGARPGDLVRSGRAEALVRLAICNAGTGAFQPQAYGARIVVERRLRGGSAALRILSEAEEVISTSSAELRALADHFCYDVDNPAAVMSQDGSREFLHGSDDRGRFRLFARAANIDEVFDNLARLLHEAPSIAAKVADVGAQFARVESRLAELKARLEDSKEEGLLLQSAAKLRRALAWAHVSAQRERREAFSERAAALRDCSNPESEAANEDAARAAAKELETAEAALRDLDSQGTREEAEAERALEERMAAARAHERRLGAEERRAVARAAEERARAERADHEADKAEREADAAAAAEDRSAADRAAAAAADEHGKALSSEAAAAAAAEAAKVALARAQVGLAEARGAVTRARARQTEGAARLRAARGSSAGSRLPASTSAAGPGAALARAAAFASFKFHRPPLGPIRALVALRPECARWGRAVTRALEARLDAFVCHDTHDAMQLRRMAASGGLTRGLHIVVYSFDTPPHVVPRSSCPPATAPTVESALIIRHQIVRNVLIDAVAIERCMLAASDAQGKELAFNSGATVRAAFLPDGTRLSLIKRSEVTRPPPPGFASAVEIGAGASSGEAGESRVHAAREAAVAMMAARAEATRADADVRHCDAALRDAEQAAAHACVALREADEVLHAARQREVEARRAHEEADARAEREAPHGSSDEEVAAAAARVAAAVEAAAIARDAAGIARAASDESARAERAAAASARSAAEALAALSSEREALLEACASSLRRARGRVQSAAQEQAFYAGAAERARQALEAAERALVDSTEAVAEAERKASQVCTEAQGVEAGGHGELPAGSDAPFLSQQLSSVMRRLAHLETRREEVAREVGVRRGQEKAKAKARVIAATLREHERLTEAHSANLGAFESAKELTGKLTAAVRDRETLYKKRRKAICKDVCVAFRSVLGRRGASGRLDIDCDGRRLCVDVAPAPGDGERQEGMLAAARVAQALREEGARAERDRAVAARHARSGGRSVRGGEGSVSLASEGTAQHLALAEAEVAAAGGGATRDSRQLSGGERSLSSLAFSLALGRATDCPFVALDEPDIFMDSRNRAACLDLLREHAAEDHTTLGRQYLVITPQSTAALLGCGGVTVHKLRKVTREEGD